MWKIVGVFVCFFAAAATCMATAQTFQPESKPDPLTGLRPEEAAAGWLSLFDGETLFGWKAESEVDWSVVDGAIRATRGTPGLLRTTSQFDNYELRLEFRATAATNSGVFVRTSPKPASPLDGCYEVNIVDQGQHEYTSGAIVGRSPASWSLDLDDTGQWHQLLIRAEGDRISVSINQKLVTEYQDPDHLGRGYIGLQFNGGEVAFRQIHLLPLQLDAWFNGRDLSAWTTRNLMPAEVEITAQQELVLRGGRGQLESEASLQDFILALDVYTHRANMNSGVFFRCIPGELLNGYESQIHNGTKNGDPLQPMDAGTGAIFRRQDARRIVAKDQSWFRQTIVAVGPHVSVWVNGYQVTDWSDTRPDHENPRNGKRLAGGTIALQGHDPETWVSFRRIYARELSARRK